MESNGMDSGLVIFLITLGVLALIFGVMFIIGRNYTKKKNNTPSN